MTSLSRAFETLALTLPRFDSLDHAATALTVVYQGEMLPVRSLRTAKLSGDQMKKLVVLVIRDLQEWGRTILVEKGLGNDDDLWGLHRPFDPGHAKIIQDAWDALSEAPVWRAFERQLTALKG